MAKVIPIKHETVIKRLLDTPEALAAYDEMSEEIALLEQLTQWRESAGLTRAEVAKRMGITPPAISRLERHITKATWQTLKRYAAACGIDLTLAARG
ncbi:helix-turn-helix transcriptional regulator [Enterobacteriaceae bacterium H20N1]|uniref:Helix-turn-helix transcriptional regulator n=1 Tax=Dryocola boscaweniae TaxID=2925397 RepID=A0A9X2W9U2_9ENTR|nr:helix-turn-helix transcriptional regulator [Dryocola boscaweniae]MCT4703307.1 helix-turn-helix transcriptional regulator [Dryocola boscaweniae]MCT4715699.1 helix-turn-helix transcriptional regulator [Dryocola boscaweniae]MCT4720475.1 helix-turn-helix transcriptional regulator [Dryocola boscaweniae]